MHQYSSLHAREGPGETRVSLDTCAAGITRVEERGKQLKREINKMGFLIIVRPIRAD
jgi:hypothetical protein